MRHAAPGPPDERTGWIATAAGAARSSRQWVAFYRSGYWPVSYQGRTLSLTNPLVQDALVAGQNVSVLIPRSVPTLPVEPAPSPAESVVAQHRDAAHGR